MVFSRTFTQDIFSIFFIFQHFLTMCFGNMAVPLIMASALCVEDDPAVTMEIIGVGFFVSGWCTILQVVFGVRYDLDIAAYSSK